MKKIITLVFFILPTLTVLAQNNSLATGSANNAVTDPSVRMGHFEMNRLNKQHGITEHVNVNYSLSPVPFSKVLDLEISTAESTFFSAAIVDAKNKEVVNWVPMQESYVYKTRINIAHIPAGKYQLVIYWENKAGHYSIPFDKTIQ